MLYFAETKNQIYGYIPPIHYNEALNSENYLFFGVGGSRSRGQGVRVHENNAKHNQKYRFFDDEKSIRMPMHSLVDHSARLVCS